MGTERHVAGLRVIYEAGCPPELERALQGIVAKWRWILPPACREISVTFVPDTDEPGLLMSCSPSPEYRMAQLNVYPRWLVEHDRERERYTVHELSHIIVGPLTEFTHWMIQREEENEVRDVFLEQYRRLMEGVVSDLMESLVAHDVLAFERG